MTLFRRISIALFSLRISLFFVMFIWTIDQYFSMGHFNTYISHILIFLELILLIFFLGGFSKRITYGLVLLIQLISTIESSKKYLVSLTNVNLLSAWPILAACFALYYLRDQDTLFTLKNTKDVEGENHRI